MSLQQELLFERLLPKYVRRFARLPTFAAADVDQAVAFMRQALAIERPSDGKDAIVRPGPSITP